MKKFYKVFDTSTKKSLINPISKNPFAFVSKNQAKSFIAYLTALGRKKGRYIVVDYNKKESEEL